jgi:hypothetical protein
MRDAIAMDLVQEKAGSRLTNEEPAAHMRDEYADLYRQWAR